MGKITSSTAAACLGHCPYMSRAKAWRLIMGVDKYEDPKPHPYFVHPVIRGMNLESGAIRQYEIETGTFVTPTGFWTHPNIAWLGSSPDGLVGDDGMVEAKCPEALHASVPAHYAIQIVVQMSCLQRAWCDFYSYVSDAETWRHRLARNLGPHVMLGVEGAIIGALCDFYDQWILTKTQPPRISKKFPRMVLGGLFPDEWLVQGAEDVNNKNLACEPQAEGV